MFVLGQGITDLRNMQVHMLLWSANTVMYSTMMA